MAWSRHSATFSMSLGFYENINKYFVSIKYEHIIQLVFFYFPYSKTLVYFSDDYVGYHIESITSATYNQNDGILSFVLPTSSQFCVHISISADNQQWQVYAPCAPSSGGSVKLSTSGAVNHARVSVCLRQRQDICSSPTSVKIGQCCYFFTFHLVPLNVYSKLEEIFHFAGELSKYAKAYNINKFENDVQNFFTQLYDFYRHVKLLLV